MAGTTSSRPYPQHLIHGGPYFQSGRGLGSIFASLLRFLRPLVIKGGRIGLKAARSSVGKAAKKALIKTGKKEASRVGKNLLRRALAGHNGKAVKEDVVAGGRNIRKEVLKGALLTAMAKRKVGLPAYIAAALRARKGKKKKKSRKSGKKKGTKKGKKKLNGRRRRRRPTKNGLLNALKLRL